MKQASGIRQLTNKVRDLSRPKAILSGSASAADTHSHRYLTDLPSSSSTRATVTAEQIEAENQRLVNEEFDHYIHDGVLCDEELEDFDLCRYWQVRTSLLAHSNDFIYSARSLGTSGQVPHAIPHRAGRYARSGICSTLRTHILTK